MSLIIYVPFFQNKTLTILILEGSSIEKHLKDANLVYSIWILLQKFITPFNHYSMRITIQFSFPHNFQLTENCPRSKLIRQMILILSGSNTRYSDVFIEKRRKHFNHPSVTYLKKFTLPQNKSGTVCKRIIIMVKGYFSMQKLVENSFKYVTTGESRIFREFQ